MQHTIRDVNAPDGTRLAVHVFTPDADEPKRDVLLLHGWPNAGRVWTDLAEALLLAAPLRVLAPDFRGFGDSDRPESGYSCETFAADALAVAEAFGSKDWALVGHSMGAKIAQLAAAERPVGLTALGLVTPAPLIGAPPGDATARKAAHGDPEKTRELLAPWSARPLSEPAQARVLEDALNTSKAAWDGWLDVMRGGHPGTGSRGRGRQGPTPERGRAEAGRGRPHPGGDLHPAPAVRTPAAPRRPARPRRPAGQLPRRPARRGGGDGVSDGNAPVNPWQDEIGFIPHLPGTPEAINSDSFDEDVLECPVPVLVEFWAARCGPCRRLAPVLDAVAREYAGRVRVFTLNVDEETDAAERFGVRAIPAVLLFESGAERARLVSDYLDRAALVHLLRPVIPAEEE